MNESSINCKLPKVAFPNEYTVEVTINGIDYTQNKLKYTFYDPVNVRLEPRLVPHGGNTLLNIIGYGYASTN